MSMIINPYAFGGSALWTLTNLTPKQAWWDADTGITLSGGGPNFSAWTPKEGSGSWGSGGYWLSSLSSFNNQSVVGFGAGQSISRSYSYAGTTFTVGFVGDMENGGSAWGRLVSFGSSSLAGDWNNTSTFNIGRVDTTDKINLTRNSMDAVSGGIAVGYDTAFICIAIFDGSTGKLYVNGSLAGTITISNAFNFNKMSLRQSSTSGGAGDFGRGKFGEIVIAERAITTTEREKLEGKWAHDFGLTGVLPSGHPYKTNPPTV